MGRAVLCYDHYGRYTHVAEALARCGDDVFYSTQALGAFADPIMSLPGMGLEGITRLTDPFSAEVDYAVFPSVGDYGMQEYMREKGLPVFGCGWGGAVETDRWTLRHLAKEAGIRMPEATLVTGIDELRKALDELDDVYVKISHYRGAMETYHHTDATASKVWLDQLAINLGPYGPLAQFTLEQPIEANTVVEVGIDTFFCGTFPRIISWGYEVKDLAFVSTTAPLPPRLHAVSDRFAMILHAYDYRGPISTEVRMTEDEEYLIDVTLRCAAPPSELQCYQISNLNDVMYGCAIGEMVEPEYRAPIGVQINLSSTWFERHALPVTMDEPANTTLVGHCIIEGQHYAINTLAKSVEHLNDFGAAVACGTKLADALEECTSVADGVHGLYVDYNKGSLDDALKAIKDGESLGLRWGR